MRPAQASPWPTRAGPTRRPPKARSRDSPSRPQDLVLYRGPSLLTGSPVVAVATGLRRPSRNTTTGPAVQVFVLAEDEDPLQAHGSGGDAAVCGGCPHRGGTCYVDLTRAPLAVYRAYRAGRYRPFDSQEHLRLFRGRFLRLGAYGDPAAVPLAVWEVICAAAGSWAGYTHQWRICEPGFARFCMASVETPDQRLRALKKGYRTFRVRLPGQPLEEGEFACPASAEAGHRLTCDRCRACSGARAGESNATPAVLFHGSPIANHRALRLYGSVMGRLLVAEGRRHPLPLVTNPINPSGGQGCSSGRC